MNAIESIQGTLESTRYLLDWLLKDLSDQDLLVRPAEGANHIAWQMGHLISSERWHITQQRPDVAMPELPEGFAAAHGRDTGGQDNGFSTKQQYQALFDQMRRATIDVVGGVSEKELDLPANGPAAAFAPTLGAVFLLVSNHTLLHGGQFTVIRRKLGKPVLF